MVWFFKMFFYLNYVYTERCLDEWSLNVNIGYFWGCNSGELVTFLFGLFCLAYIFLDLYTMFKYPVNV